MVMEGGSIQHGVDNQAGRGGGGEGGGGRAGRPRGAGRARAAAAALGKEEEAEDGGATPRKLGVKDASSADPFVLFQSS
ncbi:hypothetical protein KOW79_021543 [Hemibagrus wyckioides]|uniref:Uncharacterized protein n=1 Tax=Hemibagrus wyckioides TaxID=337641 RepID=A0A9D3S9L7_9TELE|nr:hypothetical protein KOW79_021543 [Hemibagrus wyckioides]